MLQITPQMKILVAVEPADFRRGIDGLARLCQQALHEDPFAGAVFVFDLDRRHHMVRKGLGPIVALLHHVQDLLPVAFNTGSEGSEAIRQSAGVYYVDNLREVFAEVSTSPEWVDCQFN